MKKRTQHPAMSAFITLIAIITLATSTAVSTPCDMKCHSGDSSSVVLTLERVQYGIITGDCCCCAKKELCPYGASASENGYVTGIVGSISHDVKIKPHLAAVITDLLSYTLLDRHRVGEFSSFYPPSPLLKRHRILRC